MLIRIWRDSANPMSGRVRVEREEPQEFVGWLQLLAILSRILEPGRLRPPPRQGRGQFDS